MRRSARAVRDAVGAGHRQAAAQRVAGTHFDTFSLAPTVVAGYFPIRGELDCLPLLTWLTQAGWSPALPVIPDEGPLHFHSWTPGDPLRAGRFRIPEPANGAHVTPRVLLVPLLAFDARGFRLGYGRGDYDRTLAALRQTGGVTAIGLAFDEQEVAEVPVAPTDEPLDWMLTPSGARPCRR